MKQSIPGARIHRWWSRLKGAWLQRIYGHEVTTVDDVISVFQHLSTSNASTCLLLFSHPEIKHGLTNKGIPQINIDQLNPRLLLHHFPLDGFRSTDTPMETAARVSKIADGNVFNYVTRAMKLTQGKLMKTADWMDWQTSEGTQLDQYKQQGMFGTPFQVDSTEAIFNLVWTYVVKDLDKLKKAQCTCN